MPQGAPKTKPKLKTKPSVPHFPRSKPQKTNPPGTRAPHRKRKTPQIAPKKAALIRQSGITKRISGGLTARTERLLAQKVGHLEVLGGGKKMGAEMGKGGGGKGKGKDKGKGK